jgi:hypothetical protein
MKKTISLFRYFLLAAVFVVAYSCKGDDGRDGNANVLTIKLQASSITWVAGQYVGRTANVFTLTDEHVNEDIMEHGTVLAYCFLTPEWYPLPITWIGPSSYLCVAHSYELNTIKLYAYNGAGAVNPNAAITEYRFMLITDKWVSKNTSASQEILLNLKLAGVDVNDYHQVAKYFGVE